MLLPYPLLLACYFPNLILLWHLHFQVRKIPLLISSYGKWIFYCRTIRGRESAILTEFTLFSFTCFFFFFFFWVFPRFSFSVSDCIVVLECRVSKLIHMIAEQIQLLLYFSCTCLYVRIRFTYHFVLLNVHFWVPKIGSVYHPYFFIWQEDWWLWAPFSWLETHCFYSFTSLKTINKG